jgi:hypothetical protein
MATNPYHNEAVPLHKRIAAGEKLDGTSLKTQGGNNKPAQPAKGGIAQKNK